MPSSLIKSLPLIAPLSLLRLFFEYCSHDIATSLALLLSLTLLFSLTLLLQVRVAVVAAALNFPDLLQMVGKYQVLAPLSTTSTRLHLHFLISVFV